MDRNWPSKAICLVCPWLWKRQTSLGCPFSSTKGHRRTWDYSLSFPSWLLEPGLVIPILNLFQENLTRSLWATVIQGSIGRKPPLQHNQAPRGVNADTTVQGDGVAAGQDAPMVHWVLLIITTISTAIAKRHQYRYSASRTALLGPGTQVVFPAVSVIVPFLLAQPMAARIKPARGVPLKAARTQPWVYYVPVPPALHSILLQIQPSIGFIFSFPCKHLQGRGRNMDAAVWPFSSSDFSPSLYFSPALLRRGVWCCPTRELQPKARCSTCVQGESAAFPQKNAAGRAGAVT